MNLIIVNSKIYFKLKQLQQIININSFKNEPFNNIILVNFKKKFNEIIF
jgi:hypothetical protein